GVGGALLGIGLCVLQSRYGLLRLAGESDSMVVEAYPVHFLWSDLWLVAIPVVVIGALTAWIAAAFARSRIVETRQ
ncbi:MAG: ABC transporter permease, partial [Muribaculaceae bacterium]|nr:ABC transporter permease [Muribaculaceae bacterium]